MKKRIIIFTLSTTHHNVIVEQNMIKHEGLYSPLQHVMIDKYHS